MCRSVASIQHSRKILMYSLQDLALFGCGVAWLILNAGAIFFCMWVKLRVS